MHRLRKDLSTSFAELSQTAERALKAVGKGSRESLEGGGKAEGTNREGGLKKPKALFEGHLPRSTEGHGERPGKSLAYPAIHEAFAADAVAVLTARVLFLRLLEDLDLAKRPLTDEGPERWPAFVELLVKRPKALLEEALPGLVRERFTATLEAVDEVVFDLFGLTPGERAHVKARLASFPLNRLRPRYPWEVGELRPLKGPRG